MFVVYYLTRNGIQCGWQHFPTHEEALEIGTMIATLLAEYVHGFEVSYRPSLN